MSKFSIEEKREMLKPDDYEVEIYSEGKAYLCISEPYTGKTKRRIKISLKRARKLNSLWSDWLRNHNKTTNCAYKSDQLIEKIINKGRKK